MTACEARPRIAIVKAIDDNRMTGSKTKDQRPNLVPCAVRRTPPARPAMPSPSSVLLHSPAKENMERTAQLPASSQNPMAIPYGQEEDDKDNDVEDTLLHGAHIARLSKPASRWFASTSSSKVLCLRRPTLLTALVVLCLVELFALAHLLFPGGTASFQDARTITFTRDVGFMSLDHKFDHQWHDLAGNYSGIIWSHEGEFDTGGIAMFHQLHCLTAMRNAMQAGLEGRLTAVDQHDDDHWPHCMDYLRQVIMCRADGTIERPREVFRDLIGGAERRVIVGFDEPRSCHDPLPLYGLLRENAVYPEAIVDPPAGRIA
ncbi:hypothetical protein PV04_08144 [Phialophora macrospora]|uniref:DUF3328 domain-containing protein n=1 Tax=Phialophora macrospora TaxID=1851006 RepID=A0A0D2FGR0_9EURO|nr:hypothetical protein PV04_08144 [Phialophora macrospora]